MFCQVGWSSVVGANMEMCNELCKCFAAVITIPTHKHTHTGTFDNSLQIIYQLYIFILHSFTYEIVLDRGNIAETKGVREKPTEAHMN